MAQQTTHTMSDSSETPSFRVAFTLIKDNVSHSLANQRPWREALDWRTFSRPNSIADATGRAQTNLSHYRLNYEAFALGMVVFGLIWHGVGGFVLAILLGLSWCYVLTVHNHGASLNILGTSLGRFELVTGMSVITLLLAFVFTSIGSTLITTSIFTAILVLTHATMRVTAGLPQAGDPTIPILAQAASTYVTSPPVQRQQSAPVSSSQGHTYPPAYHPIATAPPSVTVPPAGGGYHNV